MSEEFDMRYYDDEELMTRTAGAYDAATTEALRKHFEERRESAGEEQNLDQAWDQISQVVDSFDGGENETLAMLTRVRSSSDTGPSSWQETIANPGIAGASFLPKFLDEISKNPDQAPETIFDQIVDSESEKATPLVFFRRSWYKLQGSKDKILNSLGLDEKDPIRQQRQELIKTFKSRFEQLEVIHQRYDNDPKLLEGMRKQLTKATLLALTYRDVSAIERNIENFWLRRIESDPELKHGGERSSFAVVPPEKTTEQEQIYSENLGILTESHPEIDKVSFERAAHLLAMAEHWQKMQEDPEQSGFRREKKTDLSVLYWKQGVRGGRFAYKVALDMDKLPGLLELAQAFEDMNNRDEEGQEIKRGWLDGARLRMVRSLSYKPIPIEKKPEWFQDLASEVDLVMADEAVEMDQEDWIDELMSGRDSVFNCMGRAAFAMMLDRNSSRFVLKCLHRDIDGSPAGKLASGVQETTGQILGRQDQTSRHDSKSQFAAWKLATNQRFDLIPDETIEEFFADAPSEIVAHRVIEGKQLKQIKEKLDSLNEKIESLKQELVEKKYKKISLNRLLTTALLMATEADPPTSHFMVDSKGKLHVSLVGISNLSSREKINLQGLVEGRSYSSASDDILNFGDTLFEAHQQFYDDLMQAVARESLVSVMAGVAGDLEEVLSALESRITDMGTNLVGGIMISVGEGLASTANSSAYQKGEHGGVFGVCHVGSDENRQIVIRSRSTYGQMAEKIWSAIVSDKDLSFDRNNFDSIIKILDHSISPSTYAQDYNKDLITHIQNIAKSVAESRLNNLYKYALMQIKAMEMALERSES